MSETETAKLGRPGIGAAKEEEIRTLRRGGMGHKEIADKVGVSVAKVYNVLQYTGLGTPADQAPPAPEDQGDSPEGTAERAVAS